ncbi:hypothetical protein [Streptomyces sparsogenes]|uniref:Uncharacterized protein n=1 Tax=Streptomyces sparsogenes DSM 40356 TaxID=1331668 RepID=A0A1R1SK64_9ACTN|nr:hypothetical protein [Streptomyces sparsogenes]OMI38662.1 hypothetical protein SPAR_14899 [Streptomyces sparsogenes DSM 40356]
MTLFLLLLLVAIGLGITGLVVGGLFYLFVIGVVVFLADLVFLGTRLRQGGRRPVR